MWSFFIKSENNKNNKFWQKKMANKTPYIEGYYSKFTRKLIAPFIVKNENSGWQNNYFFCFLQKKLKIFRCRFYWELRMIRSYHIMFKHKKRPNLVKKVVSKNALYRGTLLKSVEQNDWIFSVFKKNFKIFSKVYKRLFYRILQGYRCNLIRLRNAKNNRF